MQERERARATGPLATTSTPTSSPPSVARKRARQTGLFPGSSEPPIVRPLVVVTRGRTETAVRCPQCDSWHRHVGLGQRRAPCGVVYRIQPRRAATRSTT
jgi:hypothetical protein